MAVLYCSSVHAVEQLVIATTEFAPYTSQSAPAGGYINDIISRAFDEVGIETQFAYVPWARALQETIDGSYQGASYGYYSAQRAKLFLHSDPIGKEQIFFFGLKGNVPSQWQQYSDLAGFRFGVTRGYNYTQKFQTFIRTGEQHVSVVNTDVQNMQMLLLGRIDLFPMEALTGWHLLRTHFEQAQLRQILMLTPALETNESHFLIPRSLPDAEVTMRKFNQGLARLKEKGTIDALQQKLRAGHYGNVQPLASALDP